METQEEVKDCLEKQLFEVELLQSIFSNSNEFVIEDNDALNWTREFLADAARLPPPPINLGFVIRFSADSLDESTKQYFQVTLSLSAILLNHFFRDISERQS